MEIAGAGSSSPFGNYGYSAKTILAKWLDEKLSVTLNGHVGYFVWFAPNANEERNAAVSNPLRIYESLDNAVKNSHKDLIDEILRKLLSVIEDSFPEGDIRAETLISELMSRVGSDRSNRPQLWRIDLARWPASSYRFVRPFEYECTGHTLPSECFVEAIL